MKWRVQDLYSHYLHVGAVLHRDVRAIAEI